MTKALVSGRCDPVGNKGFFLSGNADPGIFRAGNFFSQI